MDPEGDQAVVWLSGETVEIAVRAAGGSFSAPQILSSDEAREPVVALGPHGQVVVVWRTEFRRRHPVDSQTLEASFGSIGSDTFSAPEPVFPYEGGYGSVGPAVSITASGEVLVTWQMVVGERIAYSTRAPGASSFSAVQRIRKTGEGVEAPIFAFARSGAAVATWRGLKNVYASVREPGGDFGEPEELERGGCAPIAAAVNDAGKALVTWDVYAESCRTWSVGEADAVLASVRTAGQRFQHPTRAAELDPGTVVSAAMSPSGEPALGLLGNLVEPAGDSWVSVLAAQPNGDFGSPDAITPRHDVEQLLLGFDTAGNLYAGVETRDLEPPEGGAGEDWYKGGLLASSAPPGGSFGGEPTVLQQVEHDIVVSPVLATGGAGQAMLAWITGFYGKGPLWVSSFGT